MTSSDIEKDGLEVNQLEQHSSNGSSWTDEEEKKLVRKIDLFLSLTVMSLQLTLDPVPTIFIMYLLSYMDRTNIGNAKVAGMADDLQLDSNEYSISLVVFFVTYVFFEAPSNMILVRTRPSRYLPAIMIIWGALTCCMAAVHSFGQLVALRILVGVFESGFAPGILLIISSWYKKTEQSKRFAVYISAAVLSGAFGGLLAGAITGGLDGVHGIAGWRWLFIVEGAATIGWSFIAAFILLDFPATSKRLTVREREIAVARLQSQRVTVSTEDEPTIGKGKSFVNAVADWRTWAFVIGYMTVVGSSTLSYFYPTLVHGLGYKSTTEAQYMTIPIYAGAFVCTLITGILCDRVPRLRGFVIAGWLSIALVTAIIVETVYNFTARYVMLVVMAAGLWSSNGLALSYASSTLGDMSMEVRGIALALINAMGNLAQIYGAYLFPSGDAPKYLMGFGVITGMLAVGVVTYTTINVVLRRRKD